MRGRIRPAGGARVCGKPERRGGRQRRALWKPELPAASSPRCCTLFHEQQQAPPPQPRAGESQNWGGGEQRNLGASFPEAASLCAGESPPGGGSRLGHLAPRAGGISLPPSPPARPPRKGSPVAAHQLLPAREGKQPLQRLKEDCVLLKKTATWIRTENKIVSLSE
ncbi:unnamed protein product [Natator depressus]